MLDATDSYASLLEIDSDAIAARPLFQTLEPKPVSNSAASHAESRAPRQGDLVGTRDLVYNVGKNNQLTVRHSRVAVYPFVEQGRRNAKLRSQFFPPDVFYHPAKK
jgi:hypothetical protein